MAEFPLIFENFTEKELACPLTDDFAFHPGFPTALQRLRDLYAKPIKVTSCCRSEEYNKSIGGVKKSLHVYDNPKRDGAQGTLAVDIYLDNSQDRAEFLKLALNLDFSVYFISKTAIHIDQRVLLGEPQIFWMKG